MLPTDGTASKIAMLNDTCGNLIQVTQLLRGHIPPSCSVMVPRRTT